LGRTEKRFDQLSRQISERFIMLPWDQQGMPGKHRAMIQKSKAVIVFEDKASSNFAAGNFAK
jgi:hypothetical protein